MKRVFGLPQELSTHIGDGVEYKYYLQSLRSGMHFVYTVPQCRHRKSKTDKIYSPVAMRIAMAAMPSARLMALHRLQPNDNRFLRLISIVSLPGTLCAAQDFEIGCTHGHHAHTSGPQNTDILEELRIQDNKLATCDALSCPYTQSRCSSSTGRLHYPTRRACASKHISESS